MIKKKLKTLEQHNCERRIIHRHDDGPHPNGIACPHCESELLDSYPEVMLSSIPPQKKIHCEKCDFKGYRVS